MCAFDHKRRIINLLEFSTTRNQFPANSRAPERNADEKPPPREGGQLSRIKINLLVERVVRVLHKEVPGRNGMRSKPKTDQPDRTSESSESRNPECSSRKTIAVRLRSVVQNKKKRELLQDRQSDRQLGNRPARLGCAGGRTLATQYVVRGCPPVARYQLPCIKQPSCRVIISIRSSSQPASASDSDAAVAPAVVPGPLAPPPRPPPRIYISLYPRVASLLCLLIGD